MLTLTADYWPGSAANSVIGLSRSYIQLVKASRAVAPLLPLKRKEDLLTFAFPAHGCDACVTCVIPYKVKMTIYGIGQNGLKLAFPIKQRHLVVVD